MVYPETIPVTLAMRQEHTLDGTPVYYRTLVLEQGWVERQNLN